MGASIRLTDSLQGGVSRFYAEILRLRQILDLTAGPLPVLFLIDEFLHGTNSHDRRIGAEALVRGLVERGAIGLITTHDLALADIADVLGERAANVHFEDQIEDGQISFDYVMRAGRGAQEQRHRADAVGGAGDLTAAPTIPRDWRAQCGFELAGVARGEPVRKTRLRYHEWVAARLRRRDALPDRPARGRCATIRGICWRRRGPSSAWASCTRRRGRTPRGSTIAECAWISRYAWGDDYHDVMRRGLERLDGLLRERAGARVRIARSAWIRRRCWSGRTRGWRGSAGSGKNTCLINQRQRLVVLPGRAAGVARDRAGRAAAGPLRHLHALHRRLPDGGDRARSAARIHVDSRCASRTSRSSFAARFRRSSGRAIGAHVFGCDICQDVCPWNRRAPVTGDPAFAAARFAPRLEELAAISGGGVPRHVPRHAGHARAVFGIPAQRGGRHGQCRPREVPRAAGEAGGIGRRVGRRARALGAGRNYDPGTDGTFSGFAQERTR